MTLPRCTGCGGLLHAWQDVYVQRRTRDAWHETCLVMSKHPDAPEALRLAVKPWARRILSLTAINVAVYLATLATVCSSVR